MAAYPVEWLPTLWNGYLPRGMTVYLVEWLPTLWNDCLPCGMTVYLVERLPTLWNGCLPCGMTVYLVERLPTLWNGCLPCGMVALLPSYRTIIPFTRDEDFKRRTLGLKVEVTMQTDTDIMLNKSHTRMHACTRRIRTHTHTHTHTHTNEGYIPTEDTGL